MSTAIETSDRPAPSSPPLPAEESASPLPARARRPIAIAGIVLLAASAAVVMPRLWQTLFPSHVPPVVAASGRIEGREVTLAAKGIQGRVKRLLADEGQTVTKGQLLAELDAVQVEAQASAARAALAGLDAQVRQAALDVSYTAKNSAASIAAATAACSSAEAQVARAAAVVAHAASAQERARTLLAGGAIAQQELDAADMVLRTSRAELAAAEKEVARAEANLALAQASADTIALKRQQQRALDESRRTAAARLEEAEANLAERSIVAPDGVTIVSRAVEVGDVVSPGTPIFQVVDMNRLYVKVYVPEPDIAKLRLGDPAEVFVDAFPGRAFAGRISKIHDRAEFTPKNVETAEERLKLVFGVELMLENSDGLLKPGMPADCVIHWKTNDSDDGRHDS